MNDRVSRPDSIALIASGAIGGRLTLDEFHDLIWPDQKAIHDARSVLAVVQYLFLSSDYLSPQECEETLVDLAIIQGNYRNFLSRIESSAHLPLAVVALRLMLIPALIEAQGQIAKLTSLLSSLPFGGSAALVQPAELLQEMRQEVERVARKNEEIEDQISKLLDRARFKNGKHHSAQGVSPASPFRRI